MALEADIMQIMGHRVGTQIIDGDFTTGNPHADQVLRDTHIISGDAEHMGLKHPEFDEVLTFYPEDVREQVLIFMDDYAEDGFGMTAEEHLHLVRLLERGTVEMDGMVARIVARTLMAPQLF